MPNDISIENPYLSARKEYGDRYGSAVKDAARWRQISFLWSCFVYYSCSCTVFTKYSRSVRTSMIAVKYYIFHCTGRVFL